MTATAEEYDLFLSYKSENANIVRSVAEVLTASGLNVWFGEYQIHPDQYGDDQAINDEINKGIENSRYAILFTNNYWARSSYCQNEINSCMTVFSSRLGVSRESPRIANCFVEICIPSEDEPKTLFPVIGEVENRQRSIRFVTGQTTIEEVVAFIFSQFPDLTCNNADVPAAPGRQSLSAQMRFGVSLRLHPLKETGATFSGRSFPGEKYFFEGELNGIPVKCIVNVNPFESASQGGAFRPRFSEDVANDDRKIFDSYRLFAQWWLDQENQGDRNGVQFPLRDLRCNLFFWNGKSQFALTAQRKGQDPGTWQIERRYALVLVTNDQYHMGEASVSFQTSVRAVDARSAHQEFCRIAPVLDRMVGSAKYDSIDGLNSQTKVWKYFRTTVSLPLIIAGLAIPLFGIEAPTVVKSVGIAISSLIVVDLASLQFHRIVQLGLAFSVRLQQFGTTLRLAGGHRPVLDPNHAFLSHLAWIGLLVLSGLGLYGSRIHGLNAFTVAVGIAIDIANPWFWAVTGGVAGVTGLLNIERQRLQNAQVTSLLSMPTKFFPRMDLNRGLESVSANLVQLIAMRRKRRRFATLDLFRSGLVPVIPCSLAAVIGDVTIASIICAAVCLVLVLPRLFAFCRRFVQLSGNPVSNISPIENDSSKSVNEHCLPFEQLPQNPTTDQLECALNWVVNGLQHDVENPNRKLKLAALLVQLECVLDAGKIASWSEEEIRLCSVATSDVIRDLEKLSMSEDYMPELNELRQKRPSMSPDHR